MNPTPKPWTLDDFLIWESRQPERYEFVDGVIRPRAGAAVAHNIATQNIATLLDNVTRPKAGHVFTSAVKITSKLTGESSYPDVVATFAAIDGQATEIPEPTIVAEVLSRSTADYDRGSKLELYKAVPSLRYILLAAQDRRLVDLYRRTKAGWEVVRFTEGAVPLDEFDGALPLDAIYADVTL
jgi:Uma2 family endonuclease